MVKMSWYHKLKKKKRKKRKEKIVEIFFLTVDLKLSGLIVCQVLLFVKFKEIRLSRLHEITLSFLLLVGNFCSTHRYLAR